MLYRNSTLFAIAGLLASAGLARADGFVKPELSLDPTVVTAADATEELTPLMGVLDKVGAAKPLVDANISITGWLEAGYSFNNRHHSNEPAITPGPFNHEVGNHFMFNQFGMRFERQIADPTKFDVGGLIEMVYGTDACFMHSSGWGFNGNDPTDDGIPAGDSDSYQIDFTQAYLDVSLPIGNGLTLRMGKFISLIGYEYANPTSNPFYSHSWTFNAGPYSATGILGTYKLSDEWNVTAGFSRGWDETMEDRNSAIDFMGIVSYTPNDQLALSLAWNVGPQNAGDNGHYRIVLDPIVTWQATEQFKLGLECLYVYDTGDDICSAALYASYTLNDYLTLNGRFEAYHTSATGIGGITVDTPFDSLNIFSITLGTTITPFPNHSLGKNFVIRPEIRYDFTDSTNAPFATSGGSYRDQLVFAADLIFKF